MVAVIFAGNGINQNEGLVYSWEKLLDKVAEHLESDLSDNEGALLGAKWDKK